MKNTFLTFATIALLGSAQLAHAQREAPERGAKREQRQQMMQQMTPEERTQYRQQRMQERLKSATPEQRAKMEARMKERGIGSANSTNPQNAMQNGKRGNRAGRRGQNGGQNATNPAALDASRRTLMGTTGISDKATQDAIIAFINNEEKARRPLLQLAREVATSITQSAQAANPTGVAANATLQTRADNLIAANSKVSSTFDLYQSALAVDKTRHETALVGLDAKISYSAEPRLKAFLTLVGVIDSDALSLGGAPVIFTSATPRNSAAQTLAPRNPASRNAAPQPAQRAAQG
ncbi:hypothetical protein B1R32_107122 [Abditibacterium utsteinense]|uniref:DUF4142 domain-containing protein n=1 Tax=Abditibacterium utsteinense TaxID=1960156 RepID=A0A2S8STH3_9BACT|nr:hypothetical protein [Abditibacterium utsteinense]PQV64097.1 hypothetical protein B1R32_107122 [Abditibacterium utsteinense]